MDLNIWVIYLDEGTPAVAAADGLRLRPQVSGASTISIGGVYVQHGSDRNPRMSLLPEMDDIPTGQSSLLLTLRLPAHLSTQLHHLQKNQAPSSNARLGLPIRTRPYCCLPSQRQSHRDVASWKMSPTQPPDAAGSTVLHFLTQELTSHCSNPKATVMVKFVRSYLVAGIWVVLRFGRWETI